MTIRFSNQIVAELVQPVLGCVASREFMTDASAVAGPTGNAVWLGCVRPLACACAAGVNLQGALPVLW